MYASKRVPHSSLWTIPAPEMKIMVQHNAFYQPTIQEWVRTDKISVIGFGQISALNIGYILVIFPKNIGKTPVYRQFQEYRLSVSVKLRTNKISVIGNRIWSNIGNRLSAKFNRYAIPD